MVCLRLVLLNTFLAIPVITVFTGEMCTIEQMAAVACVTAG
jgi:hypothetical protein